MKFSGEKIIYLICLTTVLTGCSTKRNTLISRSYQNFTSHYNIYFNAKESLRQGIQKIDHTVQDDFTRILPVYKSNDPAAIKIATSEMELAILKGSKLISLHSITRKPGRRSSRSERYEKFAAKGEYNRWVDDSYLLIGKASYYSHDYHRATENFNYVIRKFPDSRNRYSANLWLAKTLIETSDNERAAEIFTMIDNDREFPKKMKKDLQIARAHYYLKNNDTTEAVTYLKKALQFPLSRKEKQRFNFILAQLNTTLGRPDEAVGYYRKVLKLKPPYPMAFNARISALELSEGKDENINNQLMKMLADDNNQEYLDRIYYAKGVIAHRNNRRSDALSDFILSVKFSNANKYQRALSSLSAAKILFDDNTYQLSTCYYDSAMAVIDNNYPGFNEIKDRSENLRQLAENLNTISREDSLQKLALMPEGQRNIFINQLISRIQTEEAKKLPEQGAQTADQNYFRQQQYRPRLAEDQNQNLWYFYNPATVGIGKAEFQRIWGKRRLEDNWRRQNKISVNSEELVNADQNSEVLKVTEVKRKSADTKSMEYYLQDIPLTDSLLEVSNEMIKEAYFNAAKLYQTHFKKLQKAIGMFEELDQRFPGNIYEIQVWYDLYLLYCEIENRERAEIFRKKIIVKYPDSEYALFLQNPLYFKEQAIKKAEIEKKYEEALSFYKSEDYPNAVKLASEIITMNPDRTTLLKVKFLEIISEGVAKERPDFISSLERYISDYPDAEPKELAVSIRDLLKNRTLDDYQQLISKGYIKEEKVHQELDTGEVSTFKDKTDRKAQVNPNEEKSVVNNPEEAEKLPEMEPPTVVLTDPFENYQGVYNKNVQKDNLYTLVFQSTAVDYNVLINYFKIFNNGIPNTITEVEQLDDFRSLIKVSGFKDLQTALRYFRKVNTDRTLQSILRNTNFRHFIITPENFKILKKGKNLSEYLNFFSRINK